MNKTWRSVKASSDYNKGRDALRGDRMTLGRFTSYAPSADLSSSLGRGNGRGKKCYTFKHEKEKVDAARADFLTRMQDAMVSLGR